MAGGGGTPSPGAYVTPSPGGQATAPPPPAPKGGGGPGARPAWPATNTPQPLPVSTGGGLALPSTQGPGGPQRKFVDEGKLRKVSGKLFAEPASVLKQLRWHGGGDGSPRRGSLADVASLPGAARGQRSAEGQAQALPLLCALGEGYRLLCMYRWVWGRARQAACWDAAAACCRCRCCACVAAAAAAAAATCSQAADASPLKAAPPAPPAARAGARRRSRRLAGCRRTTTRRAGCCAAWGAPSLSRSTTRRRPRPLPGRARCGGAARSKPPPAAGNGQQRGGRHVAQSSAGARAPSARACPRIRAPRRWTPTGSRAWSSTPRCCGTASARWSWRSWRRRRQRWTATRPTPGACWATASACRR